MSTRAVSRMWVASALLAIASMVVSIYVGYRYVRLIDCLAARDEASAVRTAAIAEATDLERAADLALLRTPGPAARAFAVEAREATDRVRAANPAPREGACD